MASTFTTDYSDFNEGVNKLLQMNEVRKRDITKIFRDADRAIVRTAKSHAPKAKKDSVSKIYASRSHKRGNLKRGIVFRASKRYKQVYYVISRAWYTPIVIGGHGSYAGVDYMGIAARATETQVHNEIEYGIIKLIQKSWGNG